LYFCKEQFMKSLVLMTFAVLVVLALLVTPSHAQWSYPPTKTVDAADTYFGKTYKDPYRWLENLKDRDVENWFKAQATVTDDLLAKIPGRDALAKEWLELDKLQPTQYSAIRYEHGRVFYKKTLGGENVGKLYFREGWTGAEKLLLDPGTYKPIGAAAGASRRSRASCRHQTVDTSRWASRRAEPSTRRFVCST
jgi:prolyl oligopeptidase